MFESYAVPRWVGTPEGGWRQIDRRLRWDNGVLAPVATLVGTRFSAGGAEPVVTMPLSSGAVSFSWPHVLPTPRVEGDTAVYESVLDGVDLRVRALVDGFTWSLVVRSRAAAQNPALDTLRLQVAATGLDVVGKPEGGFAVRDRTGAEMLSADGAVMWDAAGTSTIARSALGKGMDPAAILQSAPELAHRAELPTRVEGRDVVIVPDVRVLRAKDVVYPVVIDPWTEINKMRWGYTNQSNANKNDGVARVGNDPDGTGIERSFFAFNLQRLAGKQIRNVKFLTTMTHSYSCTPSPVSLWRSADLTVAGKQSWDGPNLQKWLEEKSGNAHKPSTGEGCSNDPQPNRPMEFAPAVLRTDLDAAKGTTNYTLALAARQADGSSESTTSWWKKFDPASTKLSVEYNTPPNTPPTDKLFETSDYTAPTQPCVTGTSRPGVRSNTPWLKAVVTDPDGSKGGLLSGTFTLQKWIGSAWTTMAGWPKTDSSVAPGSNAEVQIPKDSVATGDQLRWQVVVKDGLGGTAAPSSFCEFSIDTQGPTVTPKVSTADDLYPESTATDVLHGNLGRSGLFTFGANGQGDVASYTYQLNSGPMMTATPSSAGGSVTVWVTPNQLGKNVLTVRSYDKVGNPSAAYDYRFLVDEGSSPSAVWSLDEGTGDTVQTSPAGGPSLHLASAPTWTDDRILGTNSSTGRARAVQFNGISQSADSAAGVVDTSRSFTVAAWVKLNRLDNSYQTILSQEGTSTSAFYLQATPASASHFRFVRHTADGSTYSAYAAVATSTEQLGVWTHVAGTYDAGTQELRIYINGVFEDAAPYDPARAWNATGPMHVAQAKNAGVLNNFAAVTVGEVRVWDRAIDQTIDLRPLVDAVMVGDWEMDDNDTEAPRQAGDGSGYDRPLTLVDNPHTTQPGAPSVEWGVGTGYNFSDGLEMDGVSGSAATDANVVRTDQSFSVTAWVRRDSNTGYQAVWGQDGKVNSSAYLRYQDNYTGGAWVFGLRTKDDATGTQIAAFTVGAPGAWSHLAATYDAVTGVMRLYVNGVLRDTTTYRATWDSTGSFTVGRMKYLGGDINFWHGGIDRVRVWQGALATDDVTAQFNEA